jgi:hypothetical protein
LINEPDRLIWELTSSGSFSVKYFYLEMQFNEVVPYKFMWKVKIPLRIKNCLWLILKECILTRDVLIRGGNVRNDASFVDAMRLLNISFFNAPSPDTFGMWLVVLLVLISILIQLIIVFRIG